MISSDKSVTKPKSCTRTSLARWSTPTEQTHVQMPALTGIELIHSLLTERGLTQRDLVRARVFATASVASEVLAGKRSLTADQVRALASFYRLPADLLLRETAAA
jgi:antitoxin component HigA of HigAB toxin-antitoxin module